jgi:hypothetical protein
LRVWEGYRVFFEGVGGFFSGFRVQGEEWREEMGEGREWSKGAKEQGSKGARERGSKRE